MENQHELLKDNSLENRYMFDIESWKNFFSVTFWNGIEKKEFIIFNTRNDLPLLLKFLTETKNLLLVGFNSISYDNTLLHYLLSNSGRLLSLSGYDLATRINKLSGYIIGYDTQTKDIQKLVRDIRTKQYFKSIDLLEVIREGYATKGLKGVAINLKWHRIQDLPYAYDAIIEEHQVDEIMEYNFNDVLITELVYNHIKERLKMREVLSAKYGVNLLSNADSAIAKTLFNKFYAEISGESIEEFKYTKTKRTELYVRDLIFGWVSFETPEFNAYLQQLREVRIWNIDQKKLKVEGKDIKDVVADIPSFSHDGIEYSLGLGGIHSVDAAGIFIPEEDEILLDLDVASQYPMCILNNHVKPEHLGDTFFKVYQQVVQTRLEYKALGKTDPFAKIIEAGLKITINTVYGLFSFLYYFLYDPKATYSVTLNNQLALLMLIEQLTNNGIKIISANTDGIIIHTSKTNLERIRNIYDGWQTSTGFTLEETFYSKYIRRDINNYITVKTNGEIKSKGIFVPQLGILKGYDKPIVAIALQEYFINNIPTKQTISNLGTEYRFVNPEFPKGEQRTTDIYDYCMAQKIGSTYEHAVVIENEVEKGIQRSVRYYASNQGVGIYKKKWVDEKNIISKQGEVETIQAHWSYQTLLASSPLTIFNDYVEKLPVHTFTYRNDNPYDINFKYYIEEAEKIIANIEGREWIDVDKINAKIDKLTENYNKVLSTVQSMIEKNKTHLKTYQSQLQRGMKLAEELNNLIKLRDGQ